MPTALRRPFRLPALTLLAALLAPVRPAVADPPALAAPIGTGTPGPLRQLFLDPALADARAVGTAALGVRLESANSWSVPTQVTRPGHTVLVQLDAQADALALSARIPWARPGDEGGWRRRVATTVGWRLTAFWGGFQDGLIENWHDLVGAFNFRREGYPRDEIHLRLTELRPAEVGGPSAFDLDSGRVSIGDIAVGTQVLLLSGGQSRLTGAADGEPAWGVAGRLDFKVPLGSLGRLGGSGGPDGGLSLLATVELAPWAVLHGLAFATVTAPFSSSIALQPNPFHWGLDASLVLTAGGWALVVEDRWLSALMDGEGWEVQENGDPGHRLSSAAYALFRMQNQISVAIRRGPVTFSFHEDFTVGSNPGGKHGWFYNTNAPDAVFALSVHVPL